jgi:hypothetical protein
MEKAVQKGLKIAQNLMRDENIEEYIPFVLDIISYIINDEFDTSSLNDPTFQSDLLDISVRNDYILYKICQREIEKLDQALDVDSQIKFFITFATKYNSTVKIERINSVFEDTFNKKVDLNIESLKAHPILLIKDEMLTFRYDFFEEHFKNILLGELFKHKMEIDHSLIEILATYTKFNSSFTDDCCTRIGKFEDEKIFNFISIIEEINNYDDKKMDRQYLKQKATSAIFIIALKKLQKKHSLNIEITTDILKKLFFRKSNGVVSRLSLHGLNVITSDKIIFDFSDIKFDDCHFYDYDFFWECRFNKNTYFENSILKSLYLKEGIKTTAQESNFNLNNCIIDETIKNALNKTSECFDNIRNKKISDLKRFLKLFYKRGLMLPQREDVIRARYNGPFDEILKHLIDCHLIEEYKDGKAKLGRQWQLVETYKEDATKFCLESTMSIKMK